MHLKSFGDQSFLIAFIFWLALLTTNYNFNNTCATFKLFGGGGGGASNSLKVRHNLASMTTMHFGKGTGLPKKHCWYGKEQK
jgi:hypothetical protein